MERKRKELIGNVTIETFNINTVTRDITYFKIHCSSGKIRGK